MTCSELLHVYDKVLEGLTTRHIPWGDASLDGQFRLEVAGVIHGMSQFSENRPDAGVSLVPPLECAPPRSPSSPRVGGGGDRGCRHFAPSFTHFFRPWGASVLLRDHGASRDRREVVCEVRYDTSIVEEAAATQRGGGSWFPSPGPSRQAAE
jgi:hypothetical protein